MSDEFNEKYIATAGFEHTAITADHDLLHCAKFPKSDIWEEISWTVVGESGDDDIVLWLSTFYIQGYGKDVWLAPNQRGVEEETLFIPTPRSQRNKGMIDNDFARLVMNPAKRRPASDLIVEKIGDNHVQWRIGNRVYSMTPPVWTVKGEHASVDLDLTFTQHKQPFWEWGDFEGAAERDRGGYDVFCRVSGTIKAGGKTYVLKDAIGMKERITVGASSDPIKTLPAPRHMYWLWTLADDALVFLFEPGVPGVSLGSVVDGDEHLHFKPAHRQGNARFTELETWADPRSGLAMPCRWHLSMASSEAVVDLDIRAHGRGWLLWVLRNGVRLNHFAVCTANGTLTRTNGRVVKFEDQLMQVNWLRLISNVQEHL